MLKGVRHFAEDSPLLIEILKRTPSWVFGVAIAVGFGIHLNLAYRWFCHFQLEDKVADHSTFSKNRHGRFRDAGLFRHVFEEVIERCMKEGLVKGEGFAVDASLIKADANPTWTAKLPLSNLT
jgi:hypothetical protein